MEKAANRLSFLSLFSDDLWVYMDEDVSEKVRNYKYTHRRVREDQ